MQLNARARARTKKEDYVLLNTSNRSYHSLVSLYTGLKRVKSLEKRDRNNSANNRNCVRKHSFIVCRIFQLRVGMPD
ncbi:hypothetical protein NDU88_001072 [Pleurodeles waltl]|uniref:Uncharacterized protein n=1 Tax=Pleurodeles waltl TaxID=8319 RepID=A0AAV7SYX9_PLEWA|nr:hypothetical protein NDU88_001072 [Pleurodeles waltl]